MSGIKKALPMALAGCCAGAVAGLFGAGGGMVLVPLLTMLAHMDDRELFPSSICIMLPICLVSLGCTFFSSGLDVKTAAPYLIGSFAGGLLAARYGQKIPVKWLHRGLGLLIIWGGIRRLC